MAAYFHCIWAAAVAILHIKIKGKKKLMKKIQRSNKFTKGSNLANMAEKIILR